VKATAQRIKEMAKESWRRRRIMKKKLMAYEENLEA
jgi:hypothetical protein